MNVDAILDDKPPGVITIDIFSTLKMAAELMVRHHIAALVVTENCAPVGLISERHIVEVFAQDGKYATEMRVRQVICRELIAAAPQDTTERAMSLMTHRQVRHLPVMEKDKLLGIVSLEDLVKYHLDEIKVEANVPGDINVAAL